MAEEDPDEVDEFATKHRINHLRVLIQPLKEECDIIPQIVMDRALDIILDESNHPILVHCNKGKVRPSLPHSTVPITSRPSRA